MGTTSPDTAHMVDVGALSDFVPAPGHPTLALDAAADAQTLPFPPGCTTPSLNRTAPGHGPDGIHMLEVDPGAHFTSGGSLAGCLFAHGDGARGAVQRGGSERVGWTGAEPIVVFRTRAGGLFAIQVCRLFHRLSCPIVHRARTVLTPAKPPLRPDALPAPGLVACQRRHCGYRRPARRSEPRCRLGVR